MHENEKERNFHVEIGSGLEVGDDLENPDDFDFIPDTALSLVCLGLDHPAWALGFFIYPSVFLSTSVFLWL